VAQLDHPNIVAVYDAGESDSSPFIVMQFVEGHSLHEQRPQEIEEIVSVAKQLCAAFDHAHSHGIVHRDLKPENVVITPDGTAKLMDFGLARPVASRISSEGTIVGTVFYLAPEQALGGEVDGRADRYALGVMLYELTTGRLPFTADDPVAVISQHLHAPIVPPRAHNEGIPPALDMLIIGLMSKRPEDRPAAAGEALHTLDRLDAPEAEVALAGEVPRLDRTARPLGGSRARVGGRSRAVAEGGCR
jgi:serine/threonine-protein kinase